MISLLTGAVTEIDATNTATQAYPGTTSGVGAPSPLVSLRGQYVVLGKVANGGPATGSIYKRGVLKQTIAVVNIRMITVSPSGRYVVIGSTSPATIRIYKGA